MTTLSKPMKKFSPVAQSAMDFYIALSESLSLQAGQPDLAAFRRDASARFAEQGFPSRRDEDWKYTPVTGFLQTHYQVSGGAKIDASQIKKLLPPFDVTHLVFIDGYFSETYSDDISELPRGLNIEPVKDVLDFSQGHCALMSHEDKIQAEPFGCLNSMLFDDGVLISLEPHCQVERPILCSFLQTQDRHANTVRNKVVLAHGAQLTLIQQHVTTQSDLNALDNVVSEIEIAEHANLQQIILQDLATQGAYFGLQMIDQAEKSVFNSVYVGLGAALSRHQNVLMMDGEHIESNQSSACLATGKQVMDTRTHTEHQAWWGVSRQLHKLVLDDQAVGVFNGMIKVHQGAQKTDGQMDNKNLLLSKTAQVDSKPQLEIYADDVKCSHGSASGQISDEQIFYLRARGINQADARRLVTQAFLLEPLETVASAKAQAWLSNQLTQKLNGNTQA
ncbi:Fe-S cluster assembly protein SufD [Thiomicrospira microaerophila]|uniref:Fe-S cluster assembly protein SufD n=1 Tax=Thiomicrospira microaerophila TaxID=406020 RepID=UPI00200C9E80|nr:Fe-S cluster assembly protein SufD [Thiomicrospira microaerophila]UQB42582.1 Fe-S cluster assembly protein SufD [Thiomicrospira microaerophila]